MYAIVGLGNPGAQYAQTRHNLGFWVVDLLSKKLGSKLKSKGACEFARAQSGGEDLLLIKPQSFMNRSGEAAQPLLAFFKIPIENVIVVYDELDLDPGILKLRRGGGAGGHNGLQDMITQLGSADFFRVRIGIGHPRRAGIPQMDPADWVLGEATGDQRKALEESASRAAEAALILASEGLESAQQKFH